MTHTKQSKARFWCFLWFKIMLQTKRSNTSALSSYILQKEINPFTKELPSSSKWRFFMVEKGECFIKSPLKTTNRKEKTKQNTSFHLLRTCMAHTCRDFFPPQNFYHNLTSWLVLAPIPQRISRIVSDLETCSCSHSRCWSKHWNPGVFYSNTLSFLSIL